MSTIKWTFSSTNKKERKIEGEKITSYRIPELPMVMLGPTNPPSKMPRVPIESFINVLGSLGERVSGA